MRSNRPQAKYCFKSDSNRLFVNFFDPISAVQFNSCDDLIQIGTINIKQNSIYNEKESK